MNRAKGRQLIEQKVDDFSKNEKLYLDRSFNETETRDRFIDPFFRALGWAFEQTHLKRHLWDVYREFSQKGRSTTKKPDYAFRIDGRLKFLVEAKAPWIPLTERRPIFQAKRYAYSTNGNAPIVILTDFEEFRVFNALQRPVYKNPLQGLLKQFDLHYTQYIEKWDLLYDHFSKEAVQSGSLDALKGTLAKKTKTLDEEFLADLTEWREILAKNIAIRNLKLNVDEINEASQRILDRLVFVRNLEDRQIEPENLLLNVAETKAQISKKLIPIFRRLDSEYNGLLFQEHFSEDLIIDDAALETIIRNLCSPLSPFQFDIIEPEILGRIYEKFLGSKIRLTESHRAKIEEKPEVRHAGGVYYTPQYIVDYIIKHTVGKKIEGKSPEEIKKVKTLDPACGSGSFLLGAFDYLIKYHQHWYSEHRKMHKYKDDFFEDQSGEIQLTLQKKSKILRNNIFGVDIDREATEVAMMSLYLKLLDQGFDKGQTLLFMKGSILPDLTENIKCGNSLLTRDNLFEHDLFGNEILHPFDWKDANYGFGSIFKEDGGFDCVIGNPPYIKAQILQQFQPLATSVYKNVFTSGSKGNFDIYILFIEKAIDLLNDRGLVGFICPHKFFNQNYGLRIRDLISKKKNIVLILNFGINQVFKNATTYTCLLFLSNTPQKKFNYFEFQREVSNLEQSISKELDYFEIDSSKIVPDSWVFVNPKEEAFLSKVRYNHPSLEEITTNIFQGPKSGADPVFIVEVLELNDKECKCYSKALQRNCLIEPNILKPYVKGKYIKKFSIERNNEYIIYPYDKNARLYSEKTLKSQFPQAYTYLSEKTNRTNLNSREKGRFKKIWWSYSRPQNMKILDRIKILTPFNAFRSSFAFDDMGDFVFSAGVSGAYGLLIKDNLNLSYEYLLGLLNSSLLDKYLKIISTALRGGFYSYENKYIRQLPICIPSQEEGNKIELSKNIENMVKQVIEFRANNKVKDAEFLERKIDELVYELYDIHDTNFINRASQANISST